MDKSLDNVPLKEREGGAMLIPGDVSNILALHAAGWGKKRIAKELGFSRNTVKEYLKKRKWEPYGSPKRSKLLDPHEARVRELFGLHRGNCVVVKEELEKEGIKISSRSLQKFTSPWRKELVNRAKATVRFETPPGRQLQIDFGSMTIEIGDEPQKVYFFVATLGYSRRCYVQAFRNERQSSWLEGIEGAFQHFGGVPEELLIDNPKALVTKHNVKSGELLFNEKFHAFTAYWKVRPRACAPYRARTKGKDERSVGYLKHNAIAGRSFASWSHLESHLQEWMQKADQRIHGTTGDRPIDRTEELRPLNGRPPFIQMRELRRKVHTDACVEVDRNRYSVPWRYIGERVMVQVCDQQVMISLGPQELARHPQFVGERQTQIDPRHLQGIVGASRLSQGELMRPLSEYEEAIHG